MKLILAVLMQLFFISALGFAAQPTPSWPSPVTDSEIYGLLLFDLLEYRSAGNESSLNWDLVGWRGGDVNRIWIKSEGSSVLASPMKKEADLQLLYGRPVSSFFDAQIGARLEQAWGAGPSASRVSAAFGLQGLALYRFELEAALFLGDAGHIAGRVSATKDFLFTQKTIAQLRFETNAAVNRSDKFETGAGLNDLSLGLRVRYEIQREIAPYVGVSWSSLYGETADYRKRAGAESTELNAVAGLRFWY